MEEQPPITILLHSENAAAARGRRSIGKRQKIGFLECYKEFSRILGRLVVSMALFVGATVALRLHCKFKEKPSPV